MKKVAVVGATGYTGVELLRLLVSHPDVEVNQVTSRANAGCRVDTMFPNLRGFLDLSFTEPDTVQLAESDLIFFATTNGVAMKSVQALVAAGSRVIDILVKGVAGQAVQNMNIMFGQAEDTGLNMPGMLP